VKKTFLLFLFLGITFLSCNENSDDTIVSSPNETTRLNKPNIFTSKVIDGEIGGELVLDTTFTNSQGREINIYARLRVLEGSYKGRVNISMLTHYEDVSIQFFPEMKFNRSLRLDLIYSGVDLKELGFTTTGKVDFAYFNDTGNVELIENDISHINIIKDIIKVRNAKLYHFSRYGWIR
jgi:hypothetical protein